MYKRAAHSRHDLTAYRPPITEDFVKGHNLCFTIQLENWSHDVPHVIKELLIHHLFGSDAELLTEALRLLIELMEYMRGGVSYDTALSAVDGNFTNHLDGMIQNEVGTMKYNEEINDEHANYVDTTLTENFFELAKGMGVLLLDLYPQMVDVLEPLNIGNSDHLVCTHIEYLDYHRVSDGLGNNIRFFMSISPYEE